MRRKVDTDRPEWPTPAIPRFPTCRAAISGVLRDATGDWTAAVFLDAGLILGSFLLLCFVREKRGAARPA